MSSGRCLSRTKRVRKTEIRCRFCNFHSLRKKITKQNMLHVLWSLVTQACFTKYATRFVRLQVRTKSAQSGSEIVSHQVPMTTTLLFWFESTSLHLMMVVVLFAHKTAATTSPWALPRVQNLKRSFLKFLTVCAAVETYAQSMNAPATTNDER